MWYQPTKLSEVFDIFKVQKQSKIQVVCGNTGKGCIYSYYCTFLYHSLSYSLAIFANMDIDVYIDLKRISELYIIQVI